MFTQMIPGSDNVSLDLTMNSFGTQKESDLFGVLLGCGGRQVKRSI